LYALMQHDLKRLLAYHTVENIGIIFIGLGLALAFKAHGMAVAAALALTAGLLHVFNHSVFKSLLFFGAGAVLTATGERDMERLGGLIHRMPQTAFVFLVGCAAISALPPFNGFVSEWLTFQAILLSPQLPSWGLKLMIPAVGGLLALAAALAAACFVKAFGVSFLGRARSSAAASAKETDGLSLAAFTIHRLASDRLRRGPAWDCGFPDPNPQIQYSASSFSQPIRRVFGTVVFAAREIGEMPPPGSAAPARLTVVVHDLIWEAL